MSIAGYNINVTTVIFEDKAGDATMALFKAPAVGATILAAYINPSATFDADGSNHYTVSLLDGGADGTGTTSMGSYGGASVDYVANTGYTMTITQDAVDGGDWILVKYDEAGTVAPGNITVCVHWTAGGT